MGDYRKSLVVILVLATVVFVFAKAPACKLVCSPADFERRRNVWIAVTLIAFLAHSFWAYIVAAAVVLLFATSREPNRLAMYFLVLCAVTNLEDKITGLGLIDHFFTMNYTRLLALTILLPAFLTLWRQPDAEPFGRSWAEKLLVAYLGLFFILMLAFSTFTNSLRYGLLYGFLDGFLPYYVASRSLKNAGELRDALMAFAVAAMVLSALAMFESAFTWLLYLPLEETLGIPWGERPLMRGEFLRAQVTTGQPIPLGFVLAVAIGIFLYLKNWVASRLAWGVGMCALIAGLICTFSRGPWLGAALMLVVFVVTGPARAKALAAGGVLGVLGAPILFATPLGDKVIDYLPFVGTVDAKNITYRQKLFEVASEVIMLRPWFGAIDYQLLPQMQDMKNDVGLIDIVNVYLGVALERGLVGLALFAGFLLAVAAGIRKGMKSIGDQSDDRHVLGRGLLATLLGLMLILSTLSNAGLIPALYWPVAGLGVAYLRMLKADSAGAPGRSTPR